jgi:hypothetical protein
MLLSQILSVITAWKDSEQTVWTAADYSLGKQWKEIWRKDFLLDRKKMELEFTVFR